MEPQRAKKRKKKEEHVERIEEAVLNVAHNGLSKQQIRIPQGNLCQVLKCLVQKELYTIYVWNQVGTVSRLKIDQSRPYRCMHHACEEDDHQMRIILLEHISKHCGNMVLNGSPKTG